MNLSHLIKTYDNDGLLMYCVELKQNSQLNRLEHVDKYGNTALLNACRLGRMTAVQLLITFGASLYAINYKGQNALTLATYGGYFDIVRVLLKHRSYEDFNDSSITPAICVAALVKNGKLLDFYKSLTLDSENLRTVHGANYIDILKMHTASKCSKTLKDAPELN